MPRLGGGNTVPLANRFDGRSSFGTVQHTSARGEQLAHYEDKLAYEIDSWDLREARDAGEAITVVDARSPEAYRREHIPGAVNIPHRTMSRETTAEVDRESLVVTYCDGIGCNASTKGARNILELGFDVRELIGGLDWWKRDGYETHGEKGSNEEADCGC